MKIQHKSIDVLAVYGLHLKNLPADDKYTRFCHNITDHQIDALILNILYNQQDHHLFCAIDSEEIIGFGHLAKFGNDWELAVSVDAISQGKGVAGELMKYMIAWAKLHGIDNVFMHCITQNKKIQHLATKFGLRIVERDGLEITSRVELPKPTTLEYTNDFFVEQHNLLSKIQLLQSKWVKNLNPFLFLKNYDISNKEIAANKIKQSTKHNGK
jgi:GNAT superfamily N-acetyltransferase